MEIALALQKVLIHVRLVKGIPRLLAIQKSKLEDILNVGSTRRRTVNSSSLMIQMRQRQ